MEDHKSAYATKLLKNGDKRDGKIYVVKHKKENWVVGCEGGRAANAERLRAFEGD